MALDQLVEETPKTDIARIAWHISDPFSIPLCDTRFSYYGLSGVPSVKFDGIRTAYKPFEDDFNYRFVISSPLKLSLYGYFSDTTIDFDLDLRVTEDLTGSNVKVLFVLLEDGVEYGGTSYYGVSRWAGEEADVTVRSNGETESFSGSISVDPEWNLANCYLVAFVQDRTSREVLQTARAFRPNLSWESSFVTADDDVDRVIALDLENDTGMDLDYSLVLDKSLLPGSGEWEGKFFVDGYFVDDSCEVLLEADSSLVIDVHFLYSGEEPEEAEMTFTASYSLMRTLYSAAVLTGRKGPVIIEHDGYIVDDDQEGGSWGNGDGIVQPGELIELTTYALNPGGITAYQVESVLTTTTPGILIIVPEETFGDLAPEDRVEGGGLKVAFDEEVEPGEAVFIQEFTDLEQNVIPDTFTITVTSVDDDADLPGAAVTHLGSNYPNPFNPKTTIPFTLGESGDATLVIYDLAGREVKSFVLSGRARGTSCVVWDGRSSTGTPSSSGIYIYSLETGGERIDRKMMLIK